MYYEITYRLRDKHCENIKYTELFNIKNILEMRQEVARQIGTVSHRIILEKFKKSTPPERTLDLIE